MRSTKLKNPCGLGGVVTRDQKPARIMVRTKALFFEWWSLFARLVEPGSRREAQTSRPLMMEGVGRVKRTAASVANLQPASVTSLLSWRSAGERDGRSYPRTPPLGPQVA